MARAIDVALERCLGRAGSASAGEVAREAGVSRQAAHARLRELVRGGELVREGRGRATRYRRSAGTYANVAELTHSTDGLAEDAVWRDVKARLEPPLPSPAAEEILAYGVTELVNNAIDHANGRVIRVEVRQPPDAIEIAIEDDGIGIFENIRTHLGLTDHLQALQELHKGKLTTLPERHTGEGIFFTSKAVGRFGLESATLRWVVDNRRADVLVEDIEPRTGTRAVISVDRTPPRSLADVFAEYITSDLVFAKTRTIIKLFTLGVSFVSRSEAKRLLNGLEKFEEVTLDFHDVSGIGQGFADEVFRVWAKAHPATKLVPIRMGRAVEFMVLRALKSVEV